MADVAVVAFFTVLSIFLSYLFWKFYSTRNNVLSENKNKRVASRADVRQSRLKRFDTRAGGTNEIITANTMDQESLERKGFMEVTPAKSKSIYSKKRVRSSISAESEGKDDPVATPLKNLDELLAWTEGFDELNVSSEPLREVAGCWEQRPRTIVCHDMKGGYIEDSHNFITIPPPCWTNAAHKHMVRTLGTFITEWEDGAKRCEEIFKDKRSYETIADQLVLIAKYYNFDGWLINIENHIQPAQMNNVIEFVKYLTDEMHKGNKSSLVIWYDSVTYKGELKWQNKLNSENRVFFDISDGIFLNYGWNQIDLLASGRAAGENRRYDVYVGVDVFGRGVFGGGGWNTDKATHVIKESNLSTALFAPGWVYEKYESNFKVCQDKFWTSIAGDCFTHALGPTVPFITSFCQGYGEKWFDNGKVCFDHAWTHLSVQEIQPSFINQVYNLGEPNVILLSSVDHQTELAFRGGGCLLLEGSNKTTSRPAKAVVRLFKTDITLPSTTMISLTFKIEENCPPDVTLQLHVDKNPQYIILCPLNEDHHTLENMDNVNKALHERYGVPRSKRLDMKSLTSASVGDEHYRSFSPLSGSHHNRMAELCCDCEADDSWCIRYYLLAEKDLKGSRIKEIRLVLTNKNESNDSSIENLTQPFKLYLGEIKIIDAVVLRKPLPSISALKCIENELKCHIIDSKTQSLTLTLSWEYNDVERWERFQVYHLRADGSPVFLGLAYCLSYVVCGLVLPRSQLEIQFVVQAVSCCQRKEILNDCAKITVNWS